MKRNWLASFERALNVNCDVHQRATHSARIWSQSSPIVLGQLREPVFGYPLLIDEPEMSLPIPEEHSSKDREDSCCPVVARSIHMSSDAIRSVRPGLCKTAHQSVGPSHYADRRVKRISCPDEMEIGRDSTRIESANCIVVSECARWRSDCCRGGRLAQLLPKTICVPRKRTALRCPESCGDGLGSKRRLVRLMPDHPSSGYRPYTATR
jgi:hypothetical protein